MPDGARVGNISCRAEPKVRGRGGVHLVRLAAAAKRATVPYLPLKLQAPSRRRHCIVCGRTASPLPLPPIRSRRRSTPPPTTATTSAAETARSAPDPNPPRHRPRSTRPPDHVPSRPPQHPESTSTARAAAGPVKRSLTSCSPINAIAICGTRVLLCCRRIGRRSDPLGRGGCAGVSCELTTTPGLFLLVRRTTSSRDNGEP